MATRPRTIPQPETLGQMRQRLGLTGLVARAIHGDAEPLRDFFLYGPRQLSEQDCDALVWLIETKLLPRREGRPAGSFTPKNAALQYAYCLWRLGTRVWCEKHGFKRTPNRDGPNRVPDSLIECAVTLAQRASPKKVRDKITAEAVRDFKSKLTEADMESYIWPEDRWQMKQLALK